jgi:multiple sugar transport system substrate-binding protein
MPPRILNDLLPSIIEQGTYRHRLWSVGCFDSGLGLYVRPPTAAGWPRPAFASPA